MKKILLIQGHPDPGARHFCHALADAYAQAAKDYGHEVRVLDVARLDFPLLRDAAQWTAGKPAPAIRRAQDAIAWAQHLVIVFPLWLGDMPALLKAFFEQALRPGFAIAQKTHGRMPGRLLKGRSARLVVTMGMPAFFYRIYYRSHSVKSLKRSILEFCGIAPVRTTLVGTVESERSRGLALAGMQPLGHAGR